MGRKLVKQEAKTKEPEVVKEPVKISIKDIVLIVIFGVIAVLKHLYLNIPEFINLNEKASIIVMVLSIVGFVLIATICGAYQNKVENKNITVGRALKGELKQTYNTPQEKFISYLNSLLRTITMAAAGCIPNKSIGIIMIAIAIILIAITTIKHKFKEMDKAYTIYTVGMLAIIFEVIRA
mgnify:CR=1 FL=1